MSRPASAVPDDDITRALASDRLGVPTVLFFVMSAAAPLTFIAGTVTNAYAVTQSLALPSAFVVVGIALALFSVGYVTMSRHLPHTGAFYAYVSHGLGRSTGVGAAWTALLAYNLIQISLYGVIGSAAAPLLQSWLGLELPWWVFALVAWVLVALLGVLKVDFNAQVLAMLLVLEVLVIVVYDITYLTHPAHGLDWGSLSPAELFKPGAGAILAIVVLGFTGFESAVVFAEESRKPRRTIPLATYLAVVLIAVLYCVSSWALAQATGSDQIVKQSQEQNIDLPFNLVAPHLGSATATLGHFLFMTSIIAAMISFHNTTARYVFALGREGVLPTVAGRTSGSGAPQNGSLVQSAIAFVVIVLYAVAGWDPILKLFYIGSAAGALGILYLIFVTAIAVVVFFARDRRGESLGTTLIAPVLAIVAIAVMLVMVVANVAGLLGVTETSPLRWGVPAAFVVVGLAGMGYGSALRTRRPHVYAAIGMGAKTSVTRLADPTFAASAIGSSATAASPGTASVATASASTAPGGTTSRQGEGPR